MSKGPDGRRSVRVGAPPVPVAGVILAAGQGELFGDRHRPGALTAGLTAWLGTVPCAPLVLDTRLDSRDWQLCWENEAFAVLVARIDIVVTTPAARLGPGPGTQGCRSWLSTPSPAPAGITSQASAWHWPAIVAAEDAADRRPLAGTGTGACPAKHLAASAAAPPDLGPLALLAALPSVLRQG